MKRLFFMVLGLGLFFCAMTGAAQAQATRTWVSGVGDDANPCSRTAPCKTFPGAYSKTAVGGEIDVIDPGGFGTITIGHAITIDGGGGVMASILGSSTQAVTVNGAATDRITLRNLSLQGISQYSFPGTTGIIFNSGNLIVQHCVIENWSQYGIFNNTTQATTLTVTDTKISGAAIVGIYSKTTSGTNHVAFSNGSITNSGGGVWANANSSITVTGSTIANNSSGDGLYADPQGAANALITGVHNYISGNNVGVHVLAGGNIHIGENTISYNNFGLLSTPPNGKIQSWGDNYVAGNVSGDGVPDTPALVKI